MTFQEAAQKAAAEVRAMPAGTRWFLACDNDADGLCAAAVTALALLRLGHRFTIRPSREKDAAYYAGLFDEAWDALVLLDKGTSHAQPLAELAAKHKRRVFILDHHSVVTDPPGPPGITMLNPRLSGLDGSRDASGATTAAALALALHGTSAEAWIPTALAGAVGDWQHQGGWRGWNLDLVLRARAAGHLRVESVPRLMGVTLAEALSHAEPPLPGLHGDPAAAEGFVADLGLDPNLEVDELGRPERVTLTSAVALRHLAEGANPSTLENLVVTIDVHVRLGKSLRQVFRTVDACGRQGTGATGVAWLMGDASAQPAAQASFAKYRAALTQGLRTLRREGTTRHAALQSAWTAAAEFTGMVAGVGMTHIVRDTTRPLCVLARRPDGRIQVSTRGTHEHVSAGMDLGAACSTAARAVGCEGGGHPVAAGAVVPTEAVENFLAALDAALSGQNFRGGP